MCRLSGPTFALGISFLQFYDDGRVRAQPDSLVVNIFIWHLEEQRGTSVTVDIYTRVSSTEGYKIACVLMRPSEYHCYRPFGMLKQSVTSH